MGEGIPSPIFSYGGGAFVQICSMAANEMRGI